VHRQVRHRPLAAGKRRQFGVGGVVGEPVTGPAVDVGVDRDDVLQVAQARVGGGVHERAVVLRRRRHHGAGLAPHHQDQAAAGA
jgi:hypothetical protein